MQNEGKRIKKDGGFLEFRKLFGKRYLPLFIRILLTSYKRDRFFWTKFYYGTCM